MRTIFSHFGMTTRQRSGFFILLGLILLSELIIQFYSFNNESVNPKFTEDELHIAENYKAKDPEEFNSKKVESVELFPFNPNTLDELGFQKLGFSSKQAKSIIKYRYTLGGSFKSIEEFRASYVISGKKFKQLKPYIELKSVIKNNQYTPRYNQSISETKLKPFNLNQQNQQDFIKLGFSERQANTILNFKNSLPHKRFESLSQFKKCYAVSDYMFNQLKPYIIIKPSQSINYVNKVNKEFTKININTSLKQDWESLGFSKSEAENIIKYRDFIGEFKSLKDLKKCKYINDSMFLIIKNQVTINQ